LQKRIAELLRAFTERGWDCAPWKDASAIAREDPHAIVALERAFLPLGKSHTFLTDVLAVLPDGDWPALVSDSLSALARDPENALAQEIVHHAALQNPGALADHLPALFEIDELYRSYAGIWCFRAADDLTIKRLERALSAANSAKHPDAKYRAEYIDTRMRAFSALLHTGRPDAIRAALAAAPRLGLDEKHCRYWLQNENWELDGSALTRLYQEPPLHLAFPGGYLPAAPEHFMRELNPTWAEPRAGDPLLRFGGASRLDCGVCGEKAHHLLSLPDFELVTCLGCLGWCAPVMWTRHDPAGVALSVEGSAKTRPEFPGAPLVEEKVALVALGPRWSRLDWGHSNSRQNLNRVGGAPSWVQNADYPNCEGCGKLTHFLMQLDSGLPTSGGGEHLWGSGGIAYVFVCRPCRRSAYLWQCT
jgi:hypothetical protein